MLTHREINMNLHLPITIESFQAYLYFNAAVSGVKCNEPTQQLGEEARITPSRTETPRGSLGEWNGSTQIGLSQGH